MMWWAVWCAAVVVSSSVAVAAPAPDSLNAMDLIQMDSSVPDDENVGYAVQPSGRYAAPWLYYLADLPHDSQVLAKVAEANEDKPSQVVTQTREENFADEFQHRPNRKRRSFTVNPPVEHLQRNAFIYYMSRVAHENRDILHRIGKRARWSGTEAY